MTRVIVTGAMGHMGGIMVNLVEGAEDFSLAAAVDIRGNGSAIYKSLSDFNGEADVIVDFSFHTSAPEITDWAVRNNVAVVICTTGHDESERACIKAASEKIPVFWSANMSMGIAFLAQTAKKAAALFPDADIEIIERHHNRKADAPSGTALLLADAIHEARPDSVNVVGRSGFSKRTSPNEIGIHSLRMGNLPGTHEVIITTETQTITLGHEVYDRALFAEGALSAAGFLCGKPARMYNMKDIINA